MPLFPTHRATGSNLTAARLTALICAFFAAFVPVQATAQPVRLLGQTISITFVEKQTDASAAARTMNQKNAVVLTFRPMSQIDFERERNPGSISPAHTYGLASGLFGSWLRFSNAAQIRVTANAEGVVIEDHIFNFMQRFVIATDGKTCRATISYALDPGQTVFELREIRTKKPLALVSLAARDVVCSLGSAAIY